MDNQPLLTVADQVKAWAKRHEAIVQLADALERIGSIDQAEIAARARLEAVRTEVAATTDSLRAAQDELAGAVNAAEQARAEAETYAATKRDEAHLARSAAEQDGKERAAEILAGANREASAVLNRARERAEGNNKKSDEATANLVATQAKLADARQELATLEARIAEIRASAAALAG